MGRTFVPPLTPGCRKPTPRPGAQRNGRTGSQASGFLAWAPHGLVCLSPERHLLPQTLPFSLRSVVTWQGSRFLKLSSILSHLSFWISGMAAGGPAANVAQGTGSSWLCWALFAACEVRH